MSAPFFVLWPCPLSASSPFCVCTSVVSTANIRSVSSYFITIHPHLLHPPPLTVVSVCSTCCPLSASAPLCARQCSSPSVSAKFLRASMQSRRQHCSIMLALQKPRHDKYLAEPDRLRFTKRPIWEMTFLLAISVVLRTGGGGGVG